ncbi:hypothetical protein Cgig2_012706 [Carnegiea gigantea]|uniref:Endonuclease/exonuclease/phosphatase domain-containing protein n=1 Tax=Carnegiea gigantea TaxID=171969 RepID=A0A9Q1JQ63_9CARY|nr:hypothetical protein Cgig2_012706 [Carnegiea gigantea]
MSKHKSHDVGEKNDQDTKIRAVVERGPKNNPQPQVTPQAIKNLRRIIGGRRPNLVFLSNTKLTSTEIRVFLGEQWMILLGLFVDCIGRSSGLTMLWKKQLSVTFLSCSFHHIDILLKRMLDDHEWCFTGFYGYPETQSKFKTCDLLLDLKVQSVLPKLIGGDSNEIMFNSEKNSGPLKSHSILDVFQNTLATCDLFDLGY